jgi:hypothetical protein
MNAERSKEYWYGLYVKAKSVRNLLLQKVSGQTSDSETYKGIA